MNPVLSMLGLALRGGRLAVGDEPAALAARAGECRLLRTASDAGGSVMRHAEHLAEAGHCLWLTIPFSKAELGGALGRGTAAVAAVTDLGLAAAVVSGLSGNIEMTLVYVIIGGVFLYFAYTTWRKKGE